MYKCNVCDAEFTEPKDEKERHNELDGEWFEEYGVCPECGKNNFEEVKGCGCGEAYIKLTDEFCNECYEDVSKLVSRLSIDRGLAWVDARELVSSWLEKN